MIVTSAEGKKTSPVSWKDVVASTLLQRDEAAAGRYGDRLRGDEVVVEMTHPDERRALPRIEKNVFFDEYFARLSDGMDGTGFRNGRLEAGLPSTTRPAERSRALSGNRWWVGSVGQRS